MKTYRTIDLLKKAYDGEIFKNKFRNVKTGKEIEQGKTSLINFFYVDTHENIFNISSNFVTIDVNKILKQEWEEVWEPVTFMEAAQAYCDGKTIYCEYSGCTYDYKPNRDNGCVAFCKIMNADWYIKGDEE